MPRKLFQFRSLIQAFIAIAILACGISVRAQVTTGTVRGIVTDQTGAVVPGNAAAEKLHGVQSRRELRNFRCSTNRGVCGCEPKRSITFKRDWVHCRMRDATRFCCRQSRTWIFRSSKTLPSVKGARRSSSAPIYTTLSITRNMWRDRLMGSSQ